MGERRREMERRGRASMFGKDGVGWGYFSSVSFGVVELGVLYSDGWLKGGGWVDGWKVRFDGVIVE